MSKFDEQLSRMRALCTYGTVNEDKKQSNYTLEYHATAADGKEYGIIKECSHFYIKSTTPDKKNLAESYQYIGGWANKKNYEYESYNNALKNFELKLESINEAHDSKVNVETLDPFKKENLVVEGTEAMKNEIARQRQIMYNAAMLMNESTDYAVKGGEACSTSQPEAEAGEKGDKAKGSKEAKADPNYKGSKIGLDKKAAPFEENPKGINEVASPNEGDFDEGAKPFGTAQNGEADTEHNNSPFTKNVNESEEDDKSEDVKDDDAIADDDFDFDFDEEGEESFDDDVVADDETVDDELATDTDLDAGVEDVDDDFVSDDDVDFPSVGDGDELGGDSDLASKIADLEAQLAALKAQVEDCDKDIAADDAVADDVTDDDVEVNDDLAGEDGTDVEDDVDFGDEEDFEDEDDFEDFGEDGEESFDDDDDDEMYEAKKKVMDRIVESVVRQALKEDELHDFGKHPGYRKKPMDLPTTGQDKNEHGEDINDDSVHNEEPFGKQIGDGSPFNQLVDAVTKDVMYQLKKGAPIEDENKKRVAESLDEKKVLKIPKGNNKEAPSSEEIPPMGDASPVDPSMGGDAMDVPMAGVDPSMGGEDPSMGMGQGVGEEMPEDGMDDSNMNEKVKEITDISNELDEKGQETILKYARSVKDNSNSEKDSSEPEMGNEEPQMPMESVVFTKGQLKRINENFGVGMDDEKDDKKLTKRTDKTINKVKSSPFNSPRFK